MKRCSKLFIIRKIQIKTTMRYHLTADRTAIIKKSYKQYMFRSISRSVVSDSLRPHESQHARPPWEFTNSRSSLRLMSIESVMPSSHLILCRPLLLLLPIPPSIKVFSNESTLHMRWPKYWSFSFSIIPSKEYMLERV